MNRAQRTVLTLVRLAVLAAVIGVGSGIGGCSGRNVQGPFEGAGWNNLLGTGDSVRNLRDIYLQDLNTRNIPVTRPDVVESLKALSAAIREVESPSADPGRVRDTLLAFCKAAIPIVVGGGIEKCLKVFYAQVGMCSADPVCVDKAHREFTWCSKQPMEGAETKSSADALTLGQSEPLARAAGVETGD